MKNRPLVSFCIITYNQERYIRDAILSAFNQTYTPMEIIISDDCSTDNTVHVIEETIKNYSGPHTIKKNYNKKNLGIRENCNKVLYDISKGDIVLLAGGDDISTPDRTSTYVDIFNRFPNVMSVSCKSKMIDEYGCVIDSDFGWDDGFTIFSKYEYLTYRMFFIYSGDSRALRRKVISSFPKLKYTKAEDLYLFLRSLIIGDACYIRKRVHDTNYSKIRRKNYSEIEVQGCCDVEFAKENGLLSVKEAYLFTDKIKYIREYFELYVSPKTSCVKTFLYRVLHKVFHVKKI